MVGTYIKPNSHTQQEAASRVDAVKKICNIVGISVDYWKELVFEYGCEWVEKYFEETTQKKYLQDPECGFWAYFIDYWTRNDIDLLNAESITLELYINIKNLLINSWGNEEIQHETQPGATGGDHAVVA